MDMFFERKRFWQTKWFYGLILGLFVLGYSANLMLNSSEEEVPDKESGEASVQTDYGLEEDNPVSEEENDEDAIVDEAEADVDEVYLLRAENGVVKLYYCDGNAGDVFLRDTEIQYELLGEEDQELFQRGTDLMTKEELEEFLQDFES